MDKNFIQAKNGEFKLNNKEVKFRGFGVGTWMTIEHFMIRIPGIEKNIRQTFAEVYGRENAAEFFDNFLNCFIGDNDFSFLKSLGVNALRFALNYRHFEDDQMPGKYKQQGFKHLDRVLTLCRKHGIFAILDMHTAPGGQNPAHHCDNSTGVSLFWEDASLRERLIDLWGYIAERYKDETIIAGYDILNEPCFVSDTSAFNDFYEKTINKIRDVDNNHIIFLEGDNWSKDFSIFKKLGGYQQALSFHLYPGQHVSLRAEPERRKAELEKIISGFTALREKTGMPLWVGETGGRFPKDQMDKGMNLLKDCLNLFEKHCISWSIWTYKDAKAMGLMYPKDNTKWMSMGKDFRSKWQSGERRNTTIAKEIFKALEEKFSYSISEELKDKLSFRVFSLLDELHIQHIVKPALQNIPWKEMKEYPESFLWKNCDYLKGFTDLVKAYTSTPD